MPGRVHDALKERLPHNWSLASAEGESQLSGSGTYYRWTNWTTGQQMLVEVHESYAERVGKVDELCDQLMDAVYESFGDPLAKFTTPLYRRQQQAPGGTA